MGHSRVAVHFQQVPINQAKPPIFCCFFPFSISHSFGICSVFKGVSRRTYTITVEMDAALVRAGCCNEHRLGSFTTNIYFSHFWRLRGLRARRQHIWCLVRVGFQVHSRHLLFRSSHGREIELWVF